MTNRNRKKLNDNPYWQKRQRVISVLFCCVALGLVGRAFSLQVLDDGFLTDKARAKHEKVVDIAAHRGRILDRRMEPLAVSTPVDTIAVNPADLLKVPGGVRKLARALGRDATQLHQYLAQRSTRGSVFVSRHLDPEDAAKIVELKLAGVHIKREYRRYYPASAVTGHLLGFNNIDDRGQEGLELAFDEWLRGVPGSKRVLRDSRGGVLDDLEQITEPKPGKDLVLSIDRRLQYIAFRELEAAVIANQAKSGTMVILDPQSGEILAMVNQPTFNPNNRSERVVERYRNRAVTDVFEPGSTFKPFIVGAALEAGIVRSDTMVDTGPGHFAVQGGVIRDHKNYGRLTVAGVLRESSNIGSSKIALAMRPEHLWKELQGFGFGHLTGSSFPGERPGHINPTNAARPFEVATLAFGYGVSTTALQLAQAYSVLAADGMARPVSFFRRNQPVAAERVISADTARQIREMLQDVVVSGTGKKAAIPGYTVAGKTGTAKKASAGGYSSNRYISVFAGMVPAGSPRLVAVVMINEPSAGRYYGGDVAAPVFERVMGEAVRLFDIPPDALPAAPDRGLVIKPPVVGKKVG